MLVRTHGPFARWSMDAYDNIGVEGRGKVLDTVSVLTVEEEKFEDDPTSSEPWWYEVLAPHLTKDPSGIVIPYLWDCIHHLPRSVKFPEPGLPILLLFQDDALSVFMKNITVDGDSKPLYNAFADAIKDNASKLKVEDCFLPLSWGGAKIVKSELSLASQANCQLVISTGVSEFTTRTSTPRLMIKFKLGGRAYLACDTSNNMDRLDVYDMHCELGVVGPEGLKCEKSVIIGKGHTIDSPLRTWRSSVKFLSPQGWLETLHAMELQTAPATLWHALNHN